MHSFVGVVNKNVFNIFIYCIIFFINMWGIEMNLINGRPDMSPLL